MAGISKAQPQALQVVTDPYFGVVHSSPPSTWR